MIKTGLTTLFFSFIPATLALFLLAPSISNAKTLTVTETSSGSAAQVPIDLDGKNCGQINGVTTCPADSGLGTGGGSSRGGPDQGSFTFQVVTESVPAPGTGCSFAPASIQSCPIGSVTDGCLFNYVGGNGVTRYDTNGDLAISALTSGTICFNLDAGLPYSFEAQTQWMYVGGTGNLANASGSYTNTTTGQVLQNDPQGHGMAWFTAKNKGTLTVP